MEFSSWLLYLGVISAIIFLPGPSALLCMSHGLKFGSTKAMATVVGGAVAATILMTISILGLGAVLAASAVTFLFIKLLGAAYLIFLGYSAWRDSYKKVETQAANNELDIKQMSVVALFRKGFLVGISNPKDLLFFAALLPSFIDNQAPQLTQFLMLTITWFVVDVSAMYIYAGLGSKAGSWFANAKNIKFFDRTTGSIFILTGGALIASTSK